MTKLLAALCSAILLLCACTPADALPQNCPDPSTTHICPNGGACKITTTFRDEYSQADELKDDHLFEHCVPEVDDREEGPNECVAPRASPRISFIDAERVLSGGIISLRARFNFAVSGFTTATPQNVRWRLKDGQFRTEAIASEYLLETTTCAFDFMTVGSFIFSVPLDVIETENGNEQLIELDIELVGSLALTWSGSFKFVAGFLDSSPGASEVVRDAGSLLSDPVPGITHTALAPTHGPTTHPTGPSASPTLSPTLTPSSSRPSKSPTATKQPTLRINTKAPTQSPSGGEKHSDNGTMMYVAIGIGSIVPIAVAIALFIAFRRRADRDTVFDGELAAVKTDKKNKTARKMPWKAGTGEAKQTSLIVDTLEPDNPQSNVSEEDDKLAPLAGESSSPTNMSPKSRAPPPFSAMMASLSRARSMSRPKSAGVMNDEQREELTEFLRSRDTKLKTDKQLHAKVQKLAMYQRTDLFRALTKLYGAVPKSMETDGDSLTFE